MHTNFDDPTPDDSTPPPVFDPSIDPSDPIGTRICKEVDASKRRVAHAHGAIAALKDIERRALIAELLWEEEKREFGLTPRSPQAYFKPNSFEPIGPVFTTPINVAPKPGLVRRPKPARPKASKAKQKTTPVRGAKPDPTSIAGKVRALLAAATKLMTVEDVVDKIDGITHKQARTALDKMVDKGQATSPRSVQGALKAYRAVK